MFSHPRRPFLCVLRSCIALLLGLASTSYLWSQEKAQPASTEGDRAQAGFVIEQFNQWQTFENDGSAVEEDQGKIKIQSEAGLKRYGLLTFSYPSGTGTFEIAFIRVHKSDGSVIETPPDTAQDMPSQITREAPFYSDLHEKHIAVKGLSVGDTLEYRITQHTTKPLSPGQFWTAYRFTKDEVVLDEQLQIRVPRERPIKLKSPVSSPIIKDDGPYRSYTWHHSNPQILKTSSDKRKATEALWQQERGRLPQPDVLMTSFASWDEVGRWYGGLQTDRVKPTPEIRTKAAELTRNAKTDEEKIRALYTFVSTQFRYIGVSFGIGRYQPHAAPDVLANQYGDCKDKHTLLASLLTAAGIPAFPALISTYWDIDPDLPSPGQFNHVITVVPRESSLIWLDTTTEVGPYQYLASTLRDKRALAVWSDKPAALLSTPRELPFPSTQTFRMRAKVDDSATLEGQAEFSARGDVEYLIREGFRSVSVADWKDLVQRVSYAAGFGGEVSDVTAGPVEKLDEPFHFSYTYTRKNYGDWDNRRIPLPMPLMVINAPSDDDALPLGPTWLGVPSEDRYDTEVSLPAGYRPQLPPAIHLKKDFAEYDSTIEFKDGKLIGSRHLRTLMSEVPASEREDVKQFSRTLQDDYVAMIPLTARGTAAASNASPSQSSMATLQSLPSSSNPEAARLEEEARSQIQQRNAATAVSSLYRAVAADPKFTRAWVMLGTLLIAQGQLDGGTDAFQKAVESDPKEPAIPKALGFMLMASSHFDQAISVWQDYLKTYPDDIDGSLALGQCFVRDKRYSDAIAAYQPAAEKHPESADLQGALGSAYLSAGDKTKAGDAYRKFAGLHPNPGMLNNVAYEMAQASLELPLALDLAQQSAHDAEEDSSKIALSSLSLQDIRRLLNLAAVWDTVGWVYAKMSNYEQAESYLRASWSLSQDGVVGAHLCEVYSNQHKATNAIPTCRMAESRLSLSQMALSEAGGLMEQTETRLNHLTAGKPALKDPDGTSLVIRERTYKLPRLLPGTESAEFYVLLGSDGKSPKFQMEDMKFISGSDKMKPEGKHLRTIDFGFPSPSGAATKIVRRGILGCYQYTGCSFVLLDQSSIQSLE